MIKIDLITGFLGAGKTTLLRGYVSWLLKEGNKVGILENDLGAVNVDRLLLQDLEGAGCGLEMIAGGCDADCHRRRFKTKLIAMAMEGYDRIVVEPSGIYDVDEFFDTLCEEPLDRWYEAGSVIAVVDARLQEELTPEASYLLASEAAEAGCVVLSRCQEVQPQTLTAAVEHLNAALGQACCRRRFHLPKEEAAARDTVLCKDWSLLDEQDWRRLADCGWVAEDCLKSGFGRQEAFTSLCFLQSGLDEARLREATRLLFEDPSCGQVLRVKGFFRAEDGGWREINANRHGAEIRPVAAGQEVVIVIGQDLKKAAVERYFLHGSVLLQQAE